jgi:hypothetical protein
MTDGHIHEIHVPGGFPERRRRQIELWDAELRAQRLEGGVRGARPRGRRAAEPGEVAATVRVATCRCCSAPVRLLSPTSSVPIVRTDFSDGDRWRSVVAEALQGTREGFQANVEPIDNVEFRDLAVPQILDRLPCDVRFRVLFVVDAMAISDPIHPILAIDLHDEPGRTLRVLPSKVQSVENNVTLANMAFAEYVRASDVHEVFRGF